MTDYRLVADVQQELGESILWDDMRGELVWIDIHQGRIWRMAANGVLLSHTLPDRVGSIGLCRSGRYVAALAGGFGLFDPETGAWENGATVEPDRSATRLNDGRCDRFGNFVCGGMRESDEAEIFSQVYRLRPDGSVEALIEDIGCANSTCFSPDGRLMYFADMPTAEITIFSYDPDAKPVRQGRLAGFLDQPGLPDGSTVDAEGCIWNAQWGGGRLVRYSPEGDIIREILLPVTNPTCVGFGGADWKTLFITSATFQLNEQQRAAEPHAGSLFAVDLDVGGLPEPRFAD